MLADRQGNKLTGASSESLDHYEAAVRGFNTYRGDPVAHLDAAIASAPTMTMVHILKAGLYAVATEPEATLGVRAILAHASTLNDNDREASLLAALDPLLTNNWTDKPDSLNQPGSLFQWQVTMTCH